MNQLPKRELFGVGITDATQDEILEYIIDSLKEPSKKYYIVTPNPEIIIFAQKNPDFRNIINKAELALCDGVGLSIAAYFLGQPPKSRTTGTDLLERLCKRVSWENKNDVRKPITVGFLGAGEGVALRTAERLMGRYSGLQVVFVNEEWSEEGFHYNDKSKIKNQNAKIPIKSQKYSDSRVYSSSEAQAESRSFDKDGSRQARTVHSFEHDIDILFVAFGFPKQEEFMAEHIDKLNVKIMMGVGGAFDYISGNVSRAPGFIQSIGLEWLYRLIRQPWRAKRQSALIEFVLLLLREKLR